MCSSSISLPSLLPAGTVTTKKKYDLGSPSLQGGRGGTRKFIPPFRAGRVCGQGGLLPLQRDLSHRFVIPKPGCIGVMISAEDQHTVVLLLQDPVGEIYRCFNGRISDHYRIYNRKTDHARHLIQLVLRN